MTIHATLAKNISWKNYRKRTKESLKNVTTNQCTMLTPIELIILIEYCLSLGTLLGLMQGGNCIEFKHLLWDYSAIEA